MVAESSTPEYQRAKCKRFYYSRKLRDPVSHKAKQDRNSKNWKERHPDRVKESSSRRYREKLLEDPGYYAQADELTQILRNTVEVLEGQ